MAAALKVMIFKGKKQTSRLVWSSLFPESVINKIVYGITSGADKEKYYEHDEIDKSKLSFRHHCIMHIEKSDSHRYDHRNCHDADKKTGYQKE
jgi:hypothetical protein